MKLNCMIGDVQIKSEDSTKRDHVLIYVNDTAIMCVPNDKVDEAFKQIAASVAVAQFYVGGKR